MKKKITGIFVLVALFAIALVGGTLAYFTDKDAEKNVFTHGGIDIDLLETFDADNAKLFPAVKTDNEIKNQIQKAVTVKNLGNDEAYVRVHIAVPKILDEKQNGFDVKEKVLNLVYSNDEAGKWNWTKNLQRTGELNKYETTVDSVAYNVYVVTYEGALAKDQVTEAALDAVYMSPGTTQADVAKIDQTLSSWDVLVAAEGGQKAGFEDAFTALNTQFGAPGTYEVKWTVAP